MFYKSQKSLEKWNIVKKESLFLEVDKQEHWPIYHDSYKRGKPIKKSRNVDTKQDNKSNGSQRGLDDQQHEEEKQDTKNQENHLE